MGQLRIEYALQGRGRGVLGGQLDAEDADPLGGTTLVVTGTPTLSGAQPVVTLAGSLASAFAVLTAIDAPIYADLGPVPDPTVEPRRLVVPGRPLRVVVSAGDKISAVLATDIGSASSPGFAPSQSFPATVAFVSGNTAGSGGSNATVTQVMAANPSAIYREIVNNGSAEVELWFGSRPPDPNVGLIPKKGVVLAAGGGGRVFDVRVPTGAIYATTTVAGGLSVIEG